MEMEQAVKSFAIWEKVCNNINFFIIYSFELPLKHDTT